MTEARAAHGSAEQHQSLGPSVGARIGNLISFAGAIFNASPGRSGEGKCSLKTHSRARELVEHPTGHRPRWAYWVSPQSMDGACGFQQVSLGMASSPNSRRHLGNAVTLLTPRASAATYQLYQRDAVLVGIWLARAHVGRSELEQACEVGRTVLEWLPHINSPRGLALLRRLAGELRTRKANAHVHEFSTELDRKLQLVT
ncbi:MAG: hypothetical protein ACRDRX_19290 [Pseudonocardiaceae bacterium]